MDKKELRKIAERLGELSHAVTKGRESVNREFTMRVPAEPLRDADLVLASASKFILSILDGDVVVVPKSFISAAQRSVDWWRGDIATTRPLDDLGEILDRIAAQEKE